MTYANLLTGAAGRIDKPAHPLTHHDILRLIEPFTRRDRHVDLAASDRTKRCLVFKPIEHSWQTADQIDAHEILRLEHIRPDLYRLTRTLTLNCGLDATLQTEGADPGELLERIESVPPQRQFRTAANTTIAQSYRLLPTSGHGTYDRPAVQMQLTRAEAAVTGLNVIVHAANVKGYPADIDLIPNSADVVLPEDLLAVMGWAWGPLHKSPVGWSGKLRVRGGEPDVSRKIEARLDPMIAHLTQTLAKPPHLFHEKLRRARWAVVFRRASPLLFFAVLIAGAGALTQVEIPSGSILNLLIMGAPPLLMFGAFGMRDTPRLEVPPLPRRSKVGKWPQLAAVPLIAARDVSSDRSTLFRPE
ncbi:MULTISPECIES: hypothetical protein [Rhodopseudomonas]|uniref:hypothetical protein n=1 Tax=Rhodopseudomonas TaxID=1073 RepID=UPI0005C93804|nr:MULTISPECIES: hypothetical protein [Rhodopseudomonas]MDF3812972.1 hypothetical protein [Rhodopseudomonas sp. BAL398]WOK17491.1 hypothetical protein RBJ75_25790 [Rhodopseudomonas sp. BAL398]